MSSRYSSIDHGRVLAHDMRGAPLHYVHELSIRKDAPVSSTTVLERQGFRYHHGWKDANGIGWNVWTRLEPITGEES